METMRAGGDGVRARAGEAAVAGARGLVLAVAGFAASTVLLVLTAVSVALVPVGVGIVTTPWLLTGVRAFTGRERDLAGRWCGVRIPSAYRPPPAGAPAWRRCFGMLRDPATWRDLRWLPVRMTAGFATALLPAALLLCPLEGLALALWWVFEGGTHGGRWYGSGPAGALAAGALGAVLLFAAYRFSPALLRVHFLLARSVLSPGRAELAERVQVLTDTRRDAVDTSAAELRRIERDLHDGAQARLVAMGMDLGTAEALLDKDPARARELLARARQSSADALTELRDLVRGIHPPVLAERGLGDAVRALALRLPLEAEVAVDLHGRPEPPVESAAHFAVSEVLTNAVKHSGAGRVRVGIRHAEGVLRITVTDDGRGGAVAGAGSGLAGVERRLGTFDGVLTVSSPAGGPTTVTMEIPCVLSWPRTSSCSVTDS
ncbi:sensor histidine kinase [Streptomyces sp. NPDC054842]